MVRVGHPARIHKRELHEVCLDARVASSDAAAIVRDVRRDIDEVNVSSNFYWNLHLSWSKSSRHVVAQYLQGFPVWLCLILCAFFK